MDAKAREGRIRTQTTTFCLDSVDDDATSADFDGEAAVDAEGVATSSSATVVKLDSGVDSVDV